MMSLILLLIVVNFVLLPGIPYTKGRLDEQDRGR